MTEMMGSYPIEYSPQSFHHLKVDYTFPCHGPCQWMSMSMSITWSASLLVSSSPSLLVVSTGIPWVDYSSYVKNSIEYDQIQSKLTLESGSPSSQNGTTETKYIQIRWDLQGHHSSSDYRLFPSHSLHRYCILHCIVTPSAESRRWHYTNSSDRIFVAFLRCFVGYGTAVHVWYSSTTTKVGIGRGGRCRVLGPYEMVNGH